MLTHVEFRSDRFPPYEGEEDLVNPDLYGERLAEFLRHGLPREGFETSDPFAEDWGWVVPIRNPEFRLWIGCGHYQEYPDGFLCFIEPHKPFIRRFFRKIDTRERISALQTSLDQILSEDQGIRSKRWWTYEEFIHPLSGSHSTDAVQICYFKVKLMITASVSETRRNLSKLIEQARNGEEVVIIKDSRPVAALRPIDASDLEFATTLTDRQARGLLQIIESEPRKTFRSAAAAARFLKKDMLRRR